MNAAVRPIREVVLDGSEELSTTETNASHTLLDTNERPLRARSGFMARLDAKVNESITISKGLAWLIALVIGIVPVGLLIAVYLITGAMGYQTVVSDVSDLKERVAKLEKLDDKVNGISLTATTVQKDVEIIKKNQDVAESDRRDLIKNVSDIRIMLAQKTLTQE